MNWPYELQIGWRYTRAGRSGRKNGFISFISGVSMLGIALGVAALIIVLSVMNGFQKEVRDRMLSVVAHIEIADAQGDALPDWQATANEARKNPEVVGAAPFVVSQALIARGDDMRGVIVRGIVPKEEATVTPLAAELRDTTLARLVPGAWNVVLGIELARSLGVHEGDKVTVVLPGGLTTPAGVVRPPGRTTVTLSPSWTPSERASSMPSTTFHAPGTSLARVVSRNSAASGVTVASSFGTMPRTMTPRMSSPRAIRACDTTKGAAPTTSGFLRASFAVACQSGSASPWASAISICATTESIRSRTSFWKPFMTDRTMISAATPRAMPSIETPEMNEMKPFLRPLRPARV